MIERLTDEQLRAVARSFTEQSIEAAAVNEAIALRARVAKLESLLEECAENFEMWHEAKNILAKIYAALKDAPERRSRDDRPSEVIVREDRDEWDRGETVEPAEAIRAKCEAIARDGSFPFDIDVWLNSTKKEMTALVALAIADAIAALKEGP